MARTFECFYLGYDHDPSGRCIEEEIRSRVRQYGAGSFKMKRIAIHGGDIKRFNLPPLRIQNGRLPVPTRFAQKHGIQCVEVDALPPPELRNRIKRSNRERDGQGPLEPRREPWKRLSNVTFPRLLANWPGLSILTPPIAPALTLQAFAELIPRPRQGGLIASRS